MPLPGDGWDGSNYWSADDPGNTRGNPPGGAQDNGAGSGNFQIAAPVLALPGRGIDIGLGLAYNSRVWNKAAPKITFDIDRDWPAPGWSLGFGKIVGMGVDNGSMIVDADGTRHGYAGTITYGPNQNYTDFTGHTTDGTFIDYTHHTGIGGAMTYAQAKYPNGTVIEYGAQGTGAMYPTRITDANGNYITITYVNNQGPQIQTITDTLGRLVNFHYDANNLLTAITAPALGTGTRTLVRLHYAQLSLSYSFSGLTPVVRNSTPWVIDAIYYPGTSTGYWFGDADSYSSYGMITKVIEQRGMGFSASSLNDQGTVTPGSMTRQEVYGFQYTNLTDAPTFSSMTETWTRDGVNTDQAITNYEVHENSTPRTVTVTLPNQTKSIRYSYNAPGQYNDGLVYLDETRDANNNLLQSSTATWEPGAYGSPRPTRVEVTDERGQTTATAFSYGSVYNQVIEARDYDYGGQTLLHATRTQYDNSAHYTSRHIFNLPTVVEVYASDNTTRVSRTEYQYDGQPLTDTPDVVMHDEASNPFAPQYIIPGDCYYICDWYCYYQCDPDRLATDYNPATDFRGNVTQVTTYSNAGAEPASGAIIETRRYDITGNLVTASTSCCQQTSISYTLATQYAYPSAQTRGSSDPNSPIHITTSATYDFNTGLNLSSTDPSGRVSQRTYFAETLRPQTAFSPTGAYASYAYDEVGMSVTQTTYEVNGTIADQNVKLLDGRGQVRQEKALGVNNVWDMVDVHYDALGRVTEQSLPYRNGEQPQWSVMAYDALGRVISSQAPDGSTIQAFYNEVNRPDVASNNPGQTTRVVDAWGRERWGRTDSSDRLVEIVEPNPNGNGSVATGGYLTTYSYDTLGNLTGVAQDVQTRSFRYDSLGRLTHQKLAEQSAKLDNDGHYAISGGIWSNVFTYDDRSNLVSRTDARGVRTVFNYNNDPLNRLQSVSFDISGFGDTDHPVLAAPTITYAYVTTGDLTRLSSVTTTGINTDSFDYDSEGRIATRTQTLTNRESYPMVTDYIYDSLDRVTDVRYPAEYSNGFAPRKVVTHSYDIASRLTGLKVDGADYASQIVYNAASQTTQLKVGAAGTNQITENYGYSPQTGLLESQTITRGATKLLDLAYDYAGVNGKRTGQLIKIINKTTSELEASHQKDRNYEYDALGRLVKATGGPTVSPLWTESYSYDRFGNRLSVTASGNAAAKLNAPAEPKVTQPTDLLVKRTEIELPEALRQNESRMLSDSSFSPGRSTGTERSANPPPSFADTTRILTNSPFPATPPQTSPYKIVFASNRDGNAQIYLMNADGSNQTRLTNNSTNDESPMWSPDNTRILFQSDRDNPYSGAAEIYVMNSDGTAQTRLTNNTQDDSCPVWSPDGSKVVFQSARNDLYYQVYVMNADGTNQVNISSGTTNEGQPSWSPDGTKIAFTSERDHPGTPSIYVMNADGSNQTRLTFSSSEIRDEQPVWSPDGTKIAFVSTRDSVVESWQETDDEGGMVQRSAVRTNKEVYVMNADGSNQVRLTNNLENDDSPGWSNDGTKIIFRSERERDWCDPIQQVWIMNADGGNQIDISNNWFGDYCPSWQRITGNIPPAVSITSPTSGATFSAPANIIITANASDSDGTISKVEFYQGTTLIGTATTAPFSISWNNVAAGSYQITAKATDNSGAVTTSAAVSLTVNIAAIPIPRDGLSPLTYNVQNNQITTSGYEYDAAGNLTRSQSSAGGGQRFEYDAAGRLVNVKTDNNVLISTYGYGASNQRLITIEGNLKTYYAWSGEATIAEYTEGDTGVVSWSKSYVYLEARLLATLQPNGNGGEFTQYHHPDRLGTRLITNAVDTTVQEQVSLPFGTALDAESTGASNKRFTSYDRSATTGLNYAINRHYDSQQGRFTQVDPIGMGAVSLENPQTLNLYAYCGNDPINHTDPNGLFWGKLFRFIGKVIRVIAAVVAVAVAIIAIGAATWGFGAAIVAKLAITSGLLFTYAFGPPKVRQIIGALASFGAISGRIPLIYSLTTEGAGSNFATAARIFSGFLGVGSVSSYFQQESDTRNDASNSNRSSSRQTESTDSVIDIDGREVAVLSVAVLARPAALGGAIGISFSNIALGVGGILGLGILFYGTAVIVSQPHPPNSATNINIFRGGKRNIQNDWTDKMKREFGRNLDKICAALREAYKTATGSERAQIKAAQKYFGCRRSTGGQLN